MFPVPLNSWKMTSSMREPVSISAVATIVSEPQSSALRAAPKKRRGFSIVRASMPPERILPDPRCSLLYARDMRVIESQRMTTSFFISTRRRARSRTTSAMRM